MSILHRIAAFNNPLVFIGVIAIIILLAGLFINFFLQFSEARRYIKMEMNRAMSENEYKRWKKELRKLYLSAIPFIGRFFDD